LDIGCGPGSFLTVLAEEIPDIDGHGVDIAKAQIEYGKRELSNYPQLHFYHVKPGKLPFEDQTFDVITSIEVIEHLHPHHAIKILFEARRLLKPNGKLVITTPNYRSLWPFLEIALEKISPVKYDEQHISKFTPNSFVKFIETAGYEVTGLRSIFILSPFFTIFGFPFAKMIHLLEKSLPVHLGSLLVLEAKPGNL